MEVFVRGIPDRATENQFSNFIRPILSALNVHDWQCQKPKRKPFAFLSFLNVKDCERFLALHGQATDGFGRTYLPATRTNIVYLGVPLFCSTSKKKPDPLALKSLEMESRARLASPKAIQNHQSGPQPKPKSNDSLLRVVTVSCGIWEYKVSKHVFLSYFDWHIRGTMKFSSKSAIINLNDGTRIDLLFSTIRELNLEGLPQAAITTTLTEAPRLFRSAQVPETGVANTLLAMTEALRTMSTGPSSDPGPSRRRIPCLSSQHEPIAGACLVYRFRLESSTIDSQASEMGRAYGLLLPVRQHVNVMAALTPYKDEMNTLLSRLEIRSTFRHPANLPFSIKFQLHKLAQNGILPPRAVRALLPEIDAIIGRAGLQVCAYAIRRLSTQLPHRSLQTDSAEADIPAAISYLRENESRLSAGGFLAHEMLDRQDRVYIHRAMFTPAGMYLYGPAPESNNRVLRRYREHHEDFLRVQFCDEDGEPLRFNALYSNDVIYHERFKKILNEGFSVAGKRFNFLGFSHSSLRAQSCWFMAPFVHNGSLLFDRELIKGLGDFSQIRCPAKCAARIGQAFSETPTAITVRQGVAVEVPDIERNGRVFSDGVGTISKALLERIWAALPPGRRGKPRAFQIRYSGTCFQDCFFHHSVVALPPHMH